MCGKVLELALEVLGMVLMVKALGLDLALELSLALVLMLAQMPMVVLMWALMVAQQEPRLA